MLNAGHCREEALSASLAEHQEEVKKASKARSRDSSWSFYFQACAFVTNQHKVVYYF